MRLAIIGGSSSIGRAVIGLCAARGDDLLATWSQHQLSPAPGLEVARLDLRDPASLDRFAAVVRARGKLDAVLLLSALLPGKTLAEYDLALMQEVMTVNVTAQARLIQLLLPEMASGGQMLLMSSVSGRQGSHDPLYAASKAALLGLTRSLAAAHGRDVRFNCLAPSLVEGSAMCRAMSEERQAFHRASSSTGALLELGELARVIVDLTGPHWRQLNGATLDLGGGLRR